MKLAEALQVIGKSPAEAAPYPVLLACGFTPLHLSSYLAAHLQIRKPQQKVVIKTGLYDDLLGTVSSISQSDSALPVALVIEWSDLDPRLGFRSLGGWGQKSVPGILESALDKLRRFQQYIAQISSSQRLVVATPTLQLPPAFHTGPDQASEAELCLEAAVADFARDISSHPSVVVLNSRALDAASPRDKRYDLRSDLNSGFPYSLSHADQLGAMLAAAIQPATPKKGLITDLDDTLWLGLIGEIGHAAICWDLENHAQLHGLYQQMLQALADHGVLIAVASKNSPEVVAPAFERSDMVLRKDSVFPLEIHWEAKSESVTRILKTWNIGADAVIFVDDNALELEEVKHRHPDIECLLFPKSDYNAFYSLLQRLREAFGKPRLSEEDSFRLASIRNAGALADEDGASGVENGDLLANIDAELTFEFNPPRGDGRVLELINKTNQFNLNGIRVDQAEWDARVRTAEAFVLLVHYRDKFGPLGKIAVVQGRQQGTSLRLDSWVMSCRAFSRRIEHQVLRQLFDNFQVSEIVAEFAATPRNSPTREFFSSILDSEPAGAVTIAREIFDSKCPALYHKVILKNHEQY